MEFVNALVVTAAGIAGTEIEAKETCIFSNCLHYFPKFRHKPFTKPFLADAPLATKSSGNTSNCSVVASANSLDSSAYNSFEISTLSCLFLFQSSMYWAKSSSLTPKSVFAKAVPSSTDISRRIG